MTHPKNTTMMDVTDKDGYIRLFKLIGEPGKELPEIHYIPPLSLGIRASEYDMDPEDPRVLEMILRLHHHPETGEAKIEDHQGRPPLYTMKTVAAAADFIGERIEEVRVDRIAPAAETGNRMLADAVGNKAATKALVQVRSRLLKAVDKRLVEPVQYYRDAERERVAREEELDPAERILMQYRRDLAGPATFVDPSRRLRK